MSQPYPVFGVRGTGIHPRLEIRDLYSRPVQFSLFIRALTKIQEMRSSEEHSPDYVNKPNSYWQIASIHGLPFDPWTGDPNGPQQADPDSTYGGYCYHGAALFPTWHRVAVLLMEQAVSEQAIKIALEVIAELRDVRFENWLQAATELRFPFWDWTELETAEEGIPKIFQAPKIKIIAPDGSYTLVHNPLNHYRFAGETGVVKNLEYMDDWERTWRWVDDGENPTKDQYDMAQKAFSEPTEVTLPNGWVLKLQPVHWLRGKISALFQYPLTLEDPSYGGNLWGYFSNTSAQSAGTYLPFDDVLSSIEEPHNMVHFDIGGNGSMSLNEYAAFDPIFYLHHCNIDRIYAFWEYVYPDYWVGDGWKSEEGANIPFRTRGNFEQGPDSPVNHATSLIPFRINGSDYWTSDNTRSLLETSPTTKYYTYPPIKDPITGLEVRVDVPYDTSDESLREQFQQALLFEWLNLPEIFETVESSSKNLHPQHRSLLLEKDEATGISRLRHFVLVGHLPEFAFSGSYRLELYLLPKNRRETTARTVNNITVLGRADPEHCAACRGRRAAGSHILGHMPLDPRLIVYLISQLDYTQLPVLTDLDALSVLIKESFATRLVKPDGTILAAADPRIGAQRYDVLEEAHAPELTLHSHVLRFEQTEVRPGTITHVVKREAPVHHGLFSEKSDWKIF